MKEIEMQELNEEMEEVKIDENKNNVNNKKEKRKSYYPNEDHPLNLMEMISDANAENRIQQEFEVLEGEGKFLEINSNTKLYYEVNFFN